MQYLCVEFFFEKWLSKLSYEIKVKIKEVLTCSVVVLRYTVLKWNKILLLSVRCIWNISKNLVSGRFSTDSLSWTIFSILLSTVFGHVSKPKMRLREVVVLYIKVHWLNNSTKQTIMRIFFFSSSSLLEWPFFSISQDQIWRIQSFPCVLSKISGAKIRKKKPKKSLSTIYTWEKKGKPP